MPDIYLAPDGQQTGPYTPAQIRQMLVEGKISGESPAWMEGLAEWATVAAVMAQFPAAPAGPPPYVPPTAVRTPPAPKSEMSGCAWAAVIAGVVGFVGIIMISVLAGVAMGPIMEGVKKAQQSSAMQQVRSIDLAMFAYANDHNGSYPDGKTSTEVFQKLLDGKYVTDPGIFYCALVGKVRAVSPTLTSTNVCFDVTSGVTASSPDGLPLVFSTGYAVTYAAGAPAQFDSIGPTFLKGIAVAYKNTSATFIPAATDNTVPNLIPQTFDAGGNTYVQLKP